MLSTPLMRRAVLALAMALAVPLMAAQPAAAANVAETFVDQNLQKGLAILNNKSLNTAQRREQFQSFLLALVDTRRIALFTLGQYRRTAPPADVEAFTVAFKDYATAAYQSYFARYSGQTIKVIGSQQRAPTDYIVATQLIDPSKSQAPLEVDFRIRTDGGSPVLVDVSVAGIWLSLEQRDQFVSFLGQNNGNIRTLIAHLSDLSANLSKSAN